MECIRSQGVNLHTFTSVMPICPVSISIKSYNCDAASGIKAPVVITQIRISRVISIISNVALQQRSINDYRH